MHELYIGSTIVHIPNEDIDFDVRRALDLGRRILTETFHDVLYVGSRSLKALGEIIPAIDSEQYDLYHPSQPASLECGWHHYLGCKVETLGKPQLDLKKRTMYEVMMFGEGFAKEYANLAHRLVVGGYVALPHGPDINGTSALFGLEQLSHTLYRKQEPKEESALIHAFEQLLSA